MNMKDVKAITIPEGDVKRILINGVVVWEVPISKVLVSINTSGQTTSWYTGQTFSYNGTCTASYSDGTTAVVTPTASSPSMSSAGTKAVTLTYTEDGVTVTTSYNITVIARYWCQWTTNGTYNTGYLLRNGNYISNKGTTSNRTALVIESGGFTNNNTSKVYFLVGNTKYYVTSATESGTIYLKLTTTASQGTTWTIIKGNSTHGVWCFWDNAKQVKWNSGSAVDKLFATSGKPTSSATMGVKYTLIT